MTKPRYTKSGSNDSLNRRDEDYSAESSRLAHPRIREKLILLALRAIRTGVADTDGEKLTHQERVLLRICAGRGAPVMLPAIQRPGAQKFIADVPARIWTLRHVYGFQIECRWWMESGQKHSAYWSVLNPDGTPKMLPVQLRELETGKPKAAAAGPEPEKPTTKPTPLSAHRPVQTGLFSLEPKPVHTASRFAERERGVR